MYQSRKPLLWAVSFLAIVSFATAADAAPFYQDGFANDGTVIYRDQVTQKQWTATLTRTESSLPGYDDARNRVARLGPGWRLPTFDELRDLNHGNGFWALGIRRGPWDCYWTHPHPYTLGCAYGNGFQTPQGTKFKGHNWVIAVK